MRRISTCAAATCRACVCGGGAVYKPPTEPWLLQNDRCTCAQARQRMCPKHRCASRVRVWRLCQEGHSNSAATAVAATATTMEGDGNNADHIPFTKAVCLRLPTCAKSMRPRKNTDSALSSGGVGTLPRDPFVRKKMALGTLMASRRVTHAVASTCVGQNVIECVSSNVPSKWRPRQTGPH